MRRGIPYLQIHSSKSSLAASSAEMVVFVGINLTNLENLSTMVKMASWLASGWWKVSHEIHRNLGEWGFWRWKRLKKSIWFLRRNPILLADRTFLAEALDVVVHGLPVESASYLLLVASSLKDVLRAQMRVIR